MNLVRAFFPKSGRFSLLFEKGQGRLPPVPPLITRLVIFHLCTDYVLLNKYILIFYSHILSATYSTLDNHILSTNCIFKNSALKRQTSRNRNYGGLHTRQSPFGNSVSCGIQRVKAIRGALEIFFLVVITLIVS